MSRRCVVGLSLSPVIHHLTNCYKNTGTVLPGAWVAGLCVVAKDGSTCRSAAQLAQHANLELACINALLALIDAPLTAGHILVEKSMCITSELATIEFTRIDGKDFDANIYILDDSLMVEF